VAVIDGVESKGYDNLTKSAPVFSPDSKRVAYIAVRGEKQFIVVDGVEGKEYDGILKGTPAFSPDSKRIAYGVKRWVVVHGGKTKEFADIVNGICLVFDSSTKLHTLAVRDKEIFLVEIEITE
jgi:Tol biopolymer transport system component